MQEVYLLQSLAAKVSPWRVPRGVLERHQRGAASSGGAESARKNWKERVALPVRQRRG